MTSIGRREFVGGALAGGVTLMPHQGAQSLRTVFEAPEFPRGVGHALAVEHLNK